MIEVKTSGINLIHQSHHYYPVQQQLPYKVTQGLYDPKVVAINLTNEHRPTFTSKLNLLGHILIESYLEPNGILFQLVPIFVSVMTFFAYESVLHLSALPILIDLPLSKYGIMQRGRQRKED